jgi:hypothetical protein
VRQLDPRNIKSAKQKFYDPNIVKAFDEHYKQKTMNRPGFAGGSTL